MHTPLAGPRFPSVKPPGVLPGERRTTWDSLLNKPGSTGSPNVIAPSGIQGQTTTTRKFLRSQGSGSVAGTPAWDVLQLADLPTNASATRKFLRSVSSGAATWDTLTAADIADGTFPGAYTFTGRVSLAAGGDTFRLIPTASGTYGSANYFRWFFANGITERFYLGYVVANDQVFYLSTQEAGGKIRFRTGAGLTALTIDENQKIIPLLPTSAAGLPSGALWNNSGVVNVAP